MPKSILQQATEIETGSSLGIMSITNEGRQLIMELLTKRVEEGQDPILIEHTIAELNQMPNVPCHIDRKAPDKWRIQLGKQVIDLDRESITLALANKLPQQQSPIAPSQN